MLPCLLCHGCLPWPLQDGTPTTKTFEHVGSEIGAEEAEEVGVEHLLRLVWHCTLLSCCSSYARVMGAISQTRSELNMGFLFH